MKSSPKQESEEVSCHNIINVHGFKAFRDDTSTTFWRKFVYFLLQYMYLITKLLVAFQIINPKYKLINSSATGQAATVSTSEQESMEETNQELHPPPPKYSHIFHLSSCHRVCLSCFKKSKAEISNNLWCYLMLISFRLFKLLYVTLNCRTLRLLCIF